MPFYLPVQHPQEFKRGGKIKKYKSKVTQQQKQSQVVNVHIHEKKYRRKTTTKSKKPNSINHTVNNIGYPMQYPMQPQLQSLQPNTLLELKNRVDELEHGYRLGGNNLKHESILLNAIQPIIQEDKIAEAAPKQEVEQPNIEDEFEGLPKLVDEPQDVEEDEIDEGKYEDITPQQIESFFKAEPPKKNWVFLPEKFINAKGESKVVGWYYNRKKSITVRLIDENGKAQPLADVGAESQKTIRAKIEAYITAKERHERQAVGKTKKDDANKQRYDSEEE